jgi:histidine phosphotransferase ChpT
MDINFKLLQLLSSRLCHDLINPAGSLSFSLSLLKGDKNEDTQEALEIATASVENLLSRLSYFRMCLGAASLGKGDIALDKAKELIVDLFKEKDIRIVFAKDVIATLLTVADNRNLKLILNLFLIIFYSIQRTANINIYAKDLGDTVGVAIVAKGGGIKIGIDNIQALRLEITEADVTPKTIQSYFSAMLAKEINASIEVRDNMQEEVQIAVSFAKV